ncbi:MAG TPA: class I SAM-dependent methyltransferase [Blastocatellia bacterium]|nr:class I SAM-dependent methyltransferase [Blastocatellia bacterium]
MGFYSRHIFSRILDWSLATPVVVEQRRLTLAPARGETLEIGFGTGLNLPHYPREVTSLTVLDSERMLARRVASRIRESGIPVSQVQLDASLRLPFEDSSFDTVVTTLTLCSIADTASALAEMRRVLKPEGQYLFLEHGRSDDAKTRRRQELYNPLQRVIACGCNVNRPINLLIEEAGFRFARLDRFVLADTPRILGEMYRGIAQKN